jgi:hypothetical protein
MKWLKNIVQAVTDENRGALKKAKAIVPLVNAKRASDGRQLFYQFGYYF